MGGLGFDLLVLNHDWDSLALEKRVFIYRKKTVWISSGVFFAIFDQMPSNSSPTGIMFRIRDLYCPFTKVQKKKLRFSTPLRARLFNSRSFPSIHG